MSWLMMKDCWTLFLVLLLANCLKRKEIMHGFFRSISSIDDNDDDFVEVQVDEVFGHGCHWASTLRPIQVPGSRFIVPEIIVRHPLFTRRKLLQPSPLKGFSA
ncbi:hypothetical protein QN277_008604 [Acacia crassicarpa]|uniref:Secreted protein n=1 Tax=Acacia crassicarpa TaxID=499986 RepID=A0AAE1IQT9_9FABA|nr:hypothetical protein QN277_008604 [Acacia crassicarpa]